MPSRPSVTDIARACGVSPSTVSRALNEHADINERTRRKVMAACSRMGYCRNTAARSLRLSGSDVVALLMPDQTNELFIDKALALKDALDAAGLRWRLWSHSGGDGAERIVDEIVGFHPQGLIASGWLSARSLRMLSRSRTPLVCHDMSTELADCVALDREAAAFEMASHLLRSGRRRVLALGLGCIGPRFDGYHRARREAGIPVDPALEWNVPFGRDLFEYGHVQTFKALDAVRFDSIYAVNDASAIGSMRALSERGLAVPGDIAVAGFDGIMAGAYVTPSLTTTVQPKEEMARLAVEFLTNRVRSPKTPRQSVLLKAELAVRESA